MDSTGILQVFLAIITVVVIAGFAGVLYFLSRIERALAGEQQKGAPATTVAHREPDRVVQAVQEQAPPLRAIDPREMGSLEEYLGAIGEKYNLASFTLATSDGLLIGSTRPDAQGEVDRTAISTPRENCGTRPERNSSVSHTGERQ